MLKGFVCVLRHAFNIWAVNLQCCLTILSLLVQGLKFRQKREIKAFSSLLWANTQPRVCIHFFACMCLSRFLGIVFSFAKTPMSMSFSNLSFFFFLSRCFVQPLYKSSLYITSGHHNLKQFQMIVFVNAPMAA